MQTLGQTTLAWALDNVSIVRARGIRLGIGQLWHSDDGNKIEDAGGLFDGQSVQYTQHFKQMMY